MNSKTHLDLIPYMLFIPESTKLQATDSTKTADPQIPSVKVDNCDFVLVLTCPGLVSPGSISLFGHDCPRLDSLRAVPFLVCVEFLAEWSSFLRVPSRSGRPEDLRLVAAGRRQSVEVGVAGDLRLGDWVCRRGLDILMICGREAWRVG
jgi:hypothetical protein